MACSGFCSCKIQRCGSLTVTFSNDSAARGKRPSQDFPDRDQPLQLDAKRPCWERLRGSPPPSQKASQPALLSSPSSRAASQAYALTSSRYRDDSDLEASLLEPSDGEELDSPSGLSPEAEAKLLEDDPGDDGDDEVGPFPPFKVFRVNAEKTVGSGCASSSPEAQLPSTSGTLEKTTCGEALPPPGPSDPCSGGPASRNGSAAPEHRGHSHRDSQSRAGPGLGSSTPMFAEVGPDGDAPLSPEKEGLDCVPAGEEAAQAERDYPAAGQHTAGVSATLSAKGSMKEQASIVQELGRGERAGHPPGELEAPRLDSASNQSGACGGNPSTRLPNRPRQQIRIRQADLEGSMHSYLNHVLAHVNCPSPDWGPVNELHTLMQRVSAETRSQGRAFRHPADLTMRNYAERANRPTQRCSLGQWVIRNQRSRPPFADVPDCFERSPIPSP